MAENQDDRSREDLTEEASPHRLEEYRRKGQVTQSREISGIAVLIGTYVTAYSLSPKFGHQIGDFMKEVFHTDFSSKLDLGSPNIMHLYSMKCLHLMISIGLPICGVGFLLGILGTIAQVGPLFSIDPLMPDFGKLNPTQGLQRLVSPKQFVEALRLIVKMTLVLLVSYSLVKSEVFLSPSHFGADPVTMMEIFGKISKSGFFYLILILGIFAAVDFGLQKLEFSKNVRMTKQEAKQEHKEREGDPQIRARIRAVQREMARRRMMQAVKKADVIVTNPTHFAVALVYSQGSMSAPKVVAKGADLVAQKIKEVAKEAGVVMVENVPLARTLYKSVKVGQYIPRELYQAVAEVLAYVYKIKRNS